MTNTTSKYEVSLKIVIHEQFSVQGENTIDAISKAKQQAMSQYGGYIGDDIEVVEIQEDFL